MSAPQVGILTAIKYFAWAGEVFVARTARARRRPAMSQAWFGLAAEIGFRYPRFIGDQWSRTISTIGENLESQLVEPRKESMGGLAKGLEVLLAFGHGSPDLTLSEIAEVAGLTPATTRRCLLTLQELGYVVLSGRRFCLTPKVLDLSAAFLEAVNVERLALPYLTEIARGTGDAAAFTVLEGRDIVYLARTSARMLMRLEAHVGSRFPAFCTATGRVLLAGRSDAVIDAYLAGPLPAQTEMTVTDPSKLRRLILDARRDGFAVVEDELAYGVISLAVPLRDAEGRVVAALNTSGHSKRIGIAQIVAERLEMLRAQAKVVMAELGRVPGIHRMLSDMD